MFIKVTTFNTKRELFSINPAYGRQRFQSLVDTVNKLSPDILGTQELIESTLCSLKEKLPGYDSCGLSRKANRAGEYNTIFFKKAVFELVENSTFWLSKYPDRPSRSWFAMFPRICTFARLRHRGTGQIICAYNTHLDNLSPLSRNNGLRVIKSHIDLNSSSPSDAVILMGDFNTPQTNSKVNSILQTGGVTPLYNCYNLSKLPPDDIGRSFHGAILGKYSKNQPIDCIFISGNISLIDISIYRNKINKIYPSDHYPVSSVLSLPN